MLTNCLELIKILAWPGVVLIVFVITWFGIRNDISRLKRIRQEIKDDMVDRAQFKGWLDQLNTNTKLVAELDQTVSKLNMSMLGVRK